MVFKRPKAFLFIFRSYHGLKPSILVFKHPPDGEIPGSAIRLKPSILVFKLVFSLSFNSFKNRRLKPSILVFKLGKHTQYGIITSD